jgi:hypothetical protein
MSHFEIPRQHGPVCIPFVNMAGKEEGVPTHPAMYGRYLALDLDANNRYAIELWEEQFGRPHKTFGWGVCRQGFGLQDLDYMDERRAREVAKALNESIPIGVVEDPRDAQVRLQSVRDSIWSVT